MKKALFALLLLCFLSPIAFAGSCSGSCPSGCTSWSIVYSTNCQTGEIESFVSIHFYGTRMVVNTEQSAPGWVGMDAEALGCDPELCI